MRSTYFLSHLIFLSLLVAVGLVQFATGQDVGQNSKFLAGWSQCGGQNACPDGQSCSDAAWSGAGCSPGFSCVRQDEYYWQCKPSSILDAVTEQLKLELPISVTAIDSRKRMQQPPSPSPPQQQQQQQPAAAQPWGQCGGVNGCPSGADCGAAQWAACPEGYACVYYDEYYSQCRPGESSPSPSPKDSPLPAPSPSPEVLQESPSPEPQVPESPQPPRPSPPPPVNPSPSPKVAPIVEPLVSPTAPSPRPATKPLSPGPAEPQLETLSPEPSSPSPAPLEPIVVSVDIINGPSPSPTIAATPKQQNPVASPSPEAVAGADERADTAAAATAARANATSKAAAATNATEPVVAKVPEQVSNETTALQPAAGNGTAGREAKPPGFLGSEVNASEPNPSQPPPANVSLQYPGVTVDQFKQQYAAGSLATVSQITGLPQSNITSTVKAANAASSSSSGRRLLQQQQQDGVDVDYALDSADPAATLQRISQSTQNNGEQFYNALESNGVPLRPSISINGNMAVPVNAAAARTRSSGMPTWQKILIGALVGAAGLLLLVLLVFLCWRRCMRKQKADQQRKREAAALESAESGAAVAAAGGGADVVPGRRVDQDVQMTGKGGGAVKAYDVERGTSPDQRSRSPFVQTPEPEATMVVGPASSKQRGYSLNPSSTFESAAAAGAAAAALMEQSPRLRDTTPVLPESSPEHSPSKRAVTDATAGAAGSSAAAAAVPPPWDPSTSTRDAAATAAAVSEAREKRAAMAAVEIPKPQKASLSWRPSAPWRPPGKSNIRPLPVVDPSTVALRPTAAAAAGSSAAAEAAPAALEPPREAGSSAAAALPAAAGAGAAAAARLARSGSGADYPPTPTGGVSATAAALEGEQVGSEDDEFNSPDTPKSSGSYVSARSGAGSDQSFKSTRSDTRSEGGLSAASFQSAATGQSFQTVGSGTSFQSAATGQSFRTAASGQSFASAGSRASNLSGMSALSASHNAREWPRAAYVPSVTSEGTTDTETGSLASPEKMQPADQARR